MKDSPEDKTRISHEEFIEKFKEHLDSKYDGNISAFARHLGVSSQHVGSVAKGKKPSPKILRELGYVCKRVSIYEFESLTPVNENSDI